MLRGRVASVYTTVFAGSTPFGGLFSGITAAIGGPPLALILGGSIAVGAAVVGFFRIPGGSRLGPIPILSRLDAEHRQADATPRR
jgi:hypothetical protein